MQLFKCGQNKAAESSCKTHGAKRRYSIQLTFTFSKTTIETLEKGVKYVQS